MTQRMIIILALLLAVGTACSSQPAVVRVTLEPTQLGAGAPIYTATASLTPSHTPTATESPTITPTPSITPTATETLTPSFTPTHTATATQTPTATSTSSPTAPPSPTQPLQTLTPVRNPGQGQAALGSAVISVALGWSCGDFPCEEDVAGFLQRLQVPPGFAVSHVGRFPGQVMHITYGPDERLYATVLEEGLLQGAVYVMEADGSSRRFSGTMNLPTGLAFQPGTDVLYVSARSNPLSGGALWRIESNGRMTRVLEDLPCCFMEIGSQPNGLAFGPDGWLYMGIGSLTDHAESPRPAQQAYADIDPLEASILRINPHTGEVGAYASGLRNPVGLALGADNQFYATDHGLITGEGDRLLRIEAGGFYGWPFYRTRGCADCPPSRGGADPLPDLHRFPLYTLPAGLIAYHGEQYPSNMFDTLLVALWNGVDGGQRIVWINPRDPALLNANADAPYTPIPFLTGLIRPADLAQAPDGSVVVADYVYGHIWRVSYTGELSEQPAIDAQPTASGLLPILGDAAQPATGSSIESAPAEATSAEAAPAPATQAAPSSIFVTSTPGN